jgi:hypothetical protein
MWPASHGEVWVIAYSVFALRFSNGLRICAIVGAVP